jgi:UDP-N-acetylglucosamine acyltransferase
MDDHWMTQRLIGRSALAAVPAIRRGVDIHPTAIVANEAEIGTDVSIGPFCTVGPDAVIEDRAKLVSHVVVDGHTRIGPDAVLFPFCTVGLPPQDFKYKGEPTRCEIGARTQIREHCTIHRGTVTGLGTTRVGTDCLLMAVVHVAHDCQLGDHVIVANNAVMGGHVRIGDHAVIGGAAALHQYVRIGRLAGLNVIGLKRRGFDKAQIQTLRAAFRVLFREPGVFAARLSQARAHHGVDPLVAEVLDFIDAPSHRGLIRAGRSAAATHDAA